MISLRNYQSREQHVDRLHKSSKNMQESRCPAFACLGSKMNMPSKIPEARSTDQLRIQAKDFLDQYFVSLKMLNTDLHLRRWEEVDQEIEATGTYELTFEEICFGAKLAWRNAVRCIGRIQWKNLDVFDARHVKTAKEMFDAICVHIDYATNKGNLRSAITIFPHRKSGQGDFKVWNSQLVTYAGYRNDDESVTGDSHNVEFTEVCLKLGWKSKRTKWDILPLVLSANGEDPELFDLPKELVLEIPITHPTFSWFAELNIQWFALPAVSGMLFDCGGIEFTAAPFNGWYMGTEIGCRNLADTHRYNYLREVAIRMGLDVKNPTTLWKDQALVEINIAVLHSFQKHGVTIMDHHTASESFMKHLDNEMSARGGCPADWVWIVPPMSGSTTPVFHQEMAMYFLKPSYEYQVPAWRTHEWKNPELISLFKGRNGGGKTLKFKWIALAVKFSSVLHVKKLSERIKVDILYATETGKSETYAKMLHKIFSLRFNAKIYCMNEYNMDELSTDKLVLVVASTCGNGDAPANGQTFLKAITSENSLGNILFSVFALGSTAYPNYCSFGRTVDKHLEEIGATRLLEVTCGNELDGQLETFQRWSRDIFKVACKKFSILNANDESKAKEAPIIKFRESRNPTYDICDQLARVHRRPVAEYTLSHREDLHINGNSRTIKIILKRIGTTQRLNYQVGDHIGIFPKNRKDLTDFILTRLTNKPADLNQVVKVQTEYSSGYVDEWDSMEETPETTLKDMISNFLDITTPITQNLLEYLATCATDESDRKEILTKLVEDKVEYEKWKLWYCPTLVTVLKQFPSVKPDAATLCYKLPRLKPRFYSISSSYLAHTDEIWLTLGVLKYQTKNGSGPWNYGVCSNFLNDISIGTPVSCYVRSAPTFHLPKYSDAPLILIGAGTGIAPLRGFWEERHFLASKTSEKTDAFGKMALYFGCQNSKMVLYRKELDQMVNQHVLSAVYLALSREPSRSKTYVQDVLIKNGEEIGKQIVESGAHVYICGDCNMAEGVFQTIKGIVKDKSNLTESDADEYMKFLKAEQRYHVDVFGSTKIVAEQGQNFGSTFTSYILSFLMCSNKNRNLAKMM